MFSDLKQDSLCKIYETKIKQNEKLIEQLDQELLAFVESHPEIKTNYELLISIRGIGKLGKGIGL